MESCHPKQYIILLSHTITNYTLLSDTREHSSSVRTKFLFLGIEEKDKAELDSYLLVNQTFDKMTVF